LNSHRPTLGEKLQLRLEKRMRRRPRIGFSPGFYARFGLEDPWMADSFGGDPLQQEEDFTVVSGTAFYAHLAKLGRRRWWRDRRQRERQERLSGLKTARRVRYPGEGADGLGFHALMPPSSLAAVALDMHLPTPVGADTSEIFEDEESEKPLAWYRGRDFVPARVSRRAWHSVDHPGARVFGGTRRKDEREHGDTSAMERVGARLSKAHASRDPLLRDLESVSGLLSKGKRRKVVRMLSETEHLPVEERIVLLRRVIGGGASARVIRFQVERNLADTQTSGLDRALSRRLPQSKGLRPVLRSAPSVDWALPKPMGAEGLTPVETDEEAKSTLRRITRPSVRRQLSRSPVQTEGPQETRRPVQRRRQSEAILGRLDAAMAREAQPEAVAPSIVQRTPGRFEPISPVHEAAYIAPLGRDDSDLPEDELLADPGLRRPDRIKETRQPEVQPLDPSVLHKTPLSPKASPTRWAAARLDAPALSADFASKAPLLSALPLRIARDGEDDGRFLTVDVTREEVAKLGIRPVHTPMPEMSLLEEPELASQAEDEEVASPWHRTPRSEKETRSKRPSWDRSELSEAPESPPAEAKAVWPRPAPERPGWRAVPDDTIASTTDHGWFRTPEGVLLRSKGFRTPEGTWVSSPSYRTPMRQRAFPGLRFEPVFPAFHEEAQEAELEDPARPAVRLARRAGWEPTEKAGASPTFKTPRADFDDNIRLLSQGRADEDSPAWSDRAVGGTKIRASSELIRHLAQASDPEEIIRLIVDKGQDLTRDSALASPVVEVIKQMKSEAAKVETRTVERAPTSSSRVFSGQRSHGRAARRISGFKPLRGPGAKSTPGIGEDRVMKLAGKLRSLIHLAEVDKRQDEARKYARLSADEAPAVQAAGPSEGAASASEGDVEALIQEILSAVNREMELRRERRQDDNHEPWW